MEILSGASFYAVYTVCIMKIKDKIKYFIYEERRCTEFVRELLDLRDGLLHVDILSQN